jgi:hypothetical protein
MTLPVFRCYLPIMPSAPTMRGTKIAVSMAFRLIPRLAQQPVVSPSENALAVAMPSLEGLGAVAVAVNRCERAARLFGAAEGMRQAMGVPPIAWQRNIYENGIVALSSMLDAAAGDALRAEGRTMTLEQVVAFCLDES